MKKLLKKIFILRDEYGKKNRETFNYYNPLTYVFIPLWCIIIFFVSGIKDVIEWVKIVYAGGI